LLDVPGFPDFPGFSAGFVVGVVDP